MELETQLPKLKSKNEVLKQQVGKLNDRLKELANNLKEFEAQNVTLQDHVKVLQ